MHSESPDIDPTPAPAPNPVAVSFGTRLRLEREQRRISIASIAESTKILGALLEGLEHDDVSRWPSGFYRRAFIRAYAVAIGLDPDPIVREFSELFPDPEEVLMAAAPVTQTSSASPAWLIVPVHWPVKVTLTGDGSAFAKGRLVPEMRQRLGAIALDLFVLGVVAVALFVVLGQLWAPFSLAAAAYYASSILILGNTPGVSLFAWRAVAEKDGVRP